MDPQCQVKGEEGRFIITTVYPLGRAIYTLSLQSWNWRLKEDKALDPGYHCSSPTSVLQMCSFHSHSASQGFPGHHW